MNNPNFLNFRPRRLRRGYLFRQAVADIHLNAQNLIYPLFIHELDHPRPINAMPGIEQLPVELAVSTIKKYADQGLKQFILFGITPPERKNPLGSYATSQDAPVNRVLAQIKDSDVDVLMYADLCLCEYTDHGHCGVLETHVPHATVNNDQTLDLLQKVAQAQAKAGADVVAPSGMIDGQVGAIRQALDQTNSQHVAIMAYSVKYASHFYGPFREAGQCSLGQQTNTTHDRKSYQMDYRRSREWLTELQADIAQGADMVMVKPALAYLDILHQVRQQTSLPVAAYQVSGEYAMLHAAAQRGWLDLKQTALESTYAIKRAGADLIVTYFAPQLLEWLESC